MKKIVLASLFASVLALGSLAFASQNNKVEKADAAVIENAELYVQVKRTYDLRIDDTVILACGNHVLDGIGGNPVFATSANISGANNDGSKFYFPSSTKVMKMKAEFNTGDYIGTYSFKSLRTAAEDKDYLYNISGRYLSYAHQEYRNGAYYGYFEDGHECQTHGDVIFKAAKDEYSALNVDFDNDGYVYLSRQNEPNEFGKEGVTNPISIQWDSSYIRNKGHYGYYDGTSSVYLLRKLDLSNPKNFDFSIIKNGDKIHYEPNETSVLNGLEIQITYREEGEYVLEFNANYNDEPNFFTPMTAKSDDQKVYFKWCGMEFFYYADVSATKTDEHYYNSLEMYSEPSDMRGTYLLGVNHDEKTHVMNTSNIATTDEDAHAVQVTALDDEYISVCDKDINNEYISAVTNNLFEIVYANNGYYVKVGNKYLCKYTSDPERSYYLLYLGTIKNAFQVKYGDDGTLLTVDNDVFAYNHSSGSSGIYLNKNNDTSSPHEDAMTLFKKEYSSEINDEVQSFRSRFFEVTDVCDANGNTNLALLDWDSIETLFNSMSVDAQGFIASLTYSHDSETPESLNDMVDRYEYIVAKYGDKGFNNFMNRKISQVYEKEASISFYTNSSSIIPVVIIISIVSVLNISVLFVLRKKKEN